jgi:large repetitive protein
MLRAVGVPVTLSPGANDSSTATSTSFTPNAVGYWCFASYYSGNSNYNTSSDATVDECVNVEGPITIVTTSLPGATQGTAYSVTLVARGGTKPYRWTHIGHLPAGLSLNHTTGVLAGTPRFHGTFTINVRVKDSSRPHEIATQRLTLVIAS